jgi:asparagine synthetase B (glutamine-hydrolysing)
MIPTDREFASVLSGGVDSSLLSAYGVDLGNPKILVAVNHNGKEQISHNLKAFEKILNKKVSVLDVDAITYAGSLPECQDAISGPIYSHSFVGQALQSRFIRGQGCQAMFGGEGADELFGGYSCYLDSDRRNPSFSPSIKFDGYEHDEVRSDLGALWKNALYAYSFVKNESERAAHAMMNCDLVYQVPAVGLRGADLMSMRWSVETRSVFLRRELIKFGINLPMKFKADIKEKDNEFKTKKILKKLFVRKYKKGLLFKKQGFSGFPNESGAFLGETKYFITPEILKIPKNELVNLDRPTSWKLINMEYFLRSFSSFIA